VEDQTKTEAEELVENEGMIANHMEPLMVI
jgi:hypothetical protein